MRAQTVGRPRVRQLLVLMNAGAFSVALSFVNSVLLVRLLGADVFGQYAFLIAIVAVIPTFYETFNKVIVRFMGQLELRRQKRLLLFVLTGKSVVFAVVLVFFVAWYFLIGNSKLDAITAGSTFRWVLAAALLALPVKLVGNVFRSVLNAHESYRSVAVLTVLPTVLPVVINATLLFGGASLRTVILWVAAELALTPIAALLVSLVLLKRIGWLERIRSVRVRSFRRAIAFGYAKYFRPYGQPLATSVVFTYIKQYLPLIVLGQVSTFTNVAYYRVLAGIADLGMEFFPSVANSMLPSVAASRDRSPKDFASRFTSHGALYLLLMGIALVIFTLAHPLIFRLYDLPLTRDASLATLLVSLMIMQAALAFLLNYLFLLGGETKANYVMSPLHNVFYAICIILLTPYLLVGMMVARLLHRAFGTAMLTYVTVWRLQYIDRLQYTSLLGLTLGISAALVAAYVGVRFVVA